MAGRLQLNRCLAIAAAVVLVATAALHASGYGVVSRTIGGSGVSPAFATALRALWLMYAFHLVIVAVVAILASGATADRRILLACALVPAADAAILLRFVGLFVGSSSLAAAAVLLVAAGQTCATKHRLAADGGEWDAERRRG